MSWRRRPGLDVLMVDRAEYVRLKSAEERAQLARERDESMAAKKWAEAHASARSILADRLNKDAFSRLAVDGLLTDLPLSKSGDLHVAAFDAWVAQQRWDTSGAGSELRSILNTASARDES